MSLRNVFSAALLALSCCTPAYATVGSGMSLSSDICSDRFVFVPEVLSAPRTDGMMLSIIPRVNSDWYLEVATTREALLAGNPAFRVPATAPGTPYTVTAGVRRDFDMDDQLAAGTRYYYRLKCRSASGDVFKPRPIYTFRTLPGANARWKFAMSSDSHVISDVISDTSNCGSIWSDALQKYSAGMAHLAQWAVRNDVLFFVTAGDEQMTHAAGTQSTPCLLEYAPGLTLDNQGDVDGATQADADHEATARWVKWLQLNSAASAVLPILQAPGNHDADVTSWNNTTYDNGHTPQMGSAVRTARLATTANPVTAYYPNGRTNATGAEGPVGGAGDCDNCDANAAFWAFESGDALFMIGDVMVNSGALRGGIQRHPEYVTDWDLGMNGCAASGVDCPAGEQGYWFERLINTSSKAFKFLITHHTLGGMPQPGGISHYSRGGMLTTTSMPMGGTCTNSIPAGQIGRYCVRAGGYCPAEFTGTCSCSTAANCTDEPTSGSYAPGDYGYCVSRLGAPYVEPGTGRGIACSNETTCDPIGATAADYNCAWGFAGLETDPFAGQQEIFHQDLKAAAIDDDGASFMSYGHDHFEAWDEKNHERVHYVLGGKFTRSTTRTNWANDTNVHSQYNYRGDSLDTSCTGTGCGGVYDSSASCSDGEGCGDTKLGFTVVEVFKDESVVLQKYSNEDFPFDDLGTTVAHMRYVVDESKPSTTDRHADFSTFYDASSFGAVGNICEDHSTDSSYQLGTNGCNAGSLAAVGAVSTDVPGTYGPGGADPRRSAFIDGQTQTRGMSTPNTSNQFAYTGGMTACAWFKGTAAAKTGAILNANDNDGTSANQWSLRVVPSSGVLRMLTRTTQSDSVAVPGGHDWLAWHHYCASKSSAGAAVQFWLDGAPLACSTNCAPGAITPATGTTLGVGANTDNGSVDVDGNMHDIVLYDEVLRDEEVCKLARCGSRNTMRDRGFSCELPPGQACSYQ